MFTILHSTIAHATSTSFPLAGLPLYPSVQAKWVVASASSCVSQFDATQFSRVSERAATFTFDSQVRELMLCYKFNYLSSGRSPTAYILFPGVRVSIIRVDAAVPIATATGCSTSKIGSAHFNPQDPLERTSAPFAHFAADVTISGAGFSTLDSLAPSCTLGTSSGEARVLSDSLISCKTPTPTEVGAGELRLDFGTDLSASHPAVVSHFVSESDNPSQVASSSSSSC